MRRGVAACAIAACIVVAACSQGPDLSGMVTDMDGRPVSFSVEGNWSDAAGSDTQSSAFVGHGAVSRPDYEVHFEPKATSGAGLTGDVDGPVDEVGVGGRTYVRLGQGEKWADVADLQGALDPLPDPAANAQPAALVAGGGEASEPVAAVTVEQMGVPSPVWVLDQIGTDDHPDGGGEHWSVDVDEQDLVRHLSAWDSATGGSGEPQVDDATLEVETEGQSISSVHGRIVADLGSDGTTTWDWTLTFDPDADASPVTAPPADDLDPTPAVQEQQLAALGFPVLAPTHLPDGWKLQDASTVAAGETDEGCDQALVGFGTSDGAEWLDAYEMPPACFALVEVPPKAVDVTVGGRPAKYWLDGDTPTVAWQTDATGTVATSTLARDALLPVLDTFAVDPTLTTPR